MILRRQDVFFVSRWHVQFKIIHMFLLWLFVVLTYSILWLMD